MIPERDDVIESIQRRYKLSTKSSFDLLNIIGEDCIGAIQISSNPEILVQKKEIEGIIIFESEIAKKIRALRIPNSCINDGELNFRISLTGAQEKTAFLYQ